MERLLVGREAQSVRLLKQIAFDEQFERAVRLHAIDALEAQLAWPLDAKAWHAPVPGIGEIDRTIRAYADIVRTVQFAPLEMRGEDFAAAGAVFADKRRCRMLANDEIEVRVIGHPVALVRRALGFGDAAPRVPPAPHVAWHVGKQQIAFPRAPDWALGELKASRHLPQRRGRIDQRFELRLQRENMGHPAFLPRLIRRRPRRAPFLATLLGPSDNARLRLAPLRGGASTRGSADGRK